MDPHRGLKRALLETAFWGGAVQRCAAAELVRQRHQTPWRLPDRRVYEATLAAAKAQLAPAEYARAWLIGTSSDLLALTSTIFADTIKAHPKGVQA